MVNSHPTVKQIEKWQQDEIRKLKKAIKQELKNFEAFHEEISSKKGASTGICVLQGLQRSFKEILADLQARRQALQKSYGPPLPQAPHDSRKLYHQLLQMMD
jgi:hypothetical protein